jgi:hypothetical protein
VSEIHADTSYGAKIKCFRINGVILILEYYFQNIMKLIYS